MTQHINHLHSNGFPTVRIDIQEYPDEVTDYVTDHFQDRLLEEVIDRRRHEELFPSLYNTDADGEIVVRETISYVVVEELVYEKLREIKDEIRTGNRDDFPEQAIDGFLKHLSSLGVHTVAEQEK